MNSQKSSTFIHPQALVEPGAVIGRGTRVWAFAHVLPGAQVGEDCNLCDHVFVEGKVRIGNRVTVKCGVYLWDGLVAEDDVFIGPNATFTNDKFPRSRVHLAEYPQTILREKCSIGAGAVILPGIEIGREALVGAGAVVTHNVPAHAIVTGNPARIIGYGGTEKMAPAIPMAEAQTDDRRLIGKAELRRLTHVRDLRGDLTAAEFAKELPFQPARFFYVHNVPDIHVRGQHAHRVCHQFLVCLRGGVSVVLDNGRERQEVRLEANNVGLHIPPMLWATQYRYTADAILLVLASHAYDAGDYIRDYDQYLREIGPIQR